MRDDLPERGDEAMDRLLRAKLSGRHGVDPGAAGACLDAETVAAWADGRLHARQIAQLETHASSCPRCQALVAAVARTNPQPAAAQPWWRLSRIGLLVPVTGAAAAVVLWMVVPDRTRSPRADAVAPAGESRTITEALPEPSARDQHAPQPVRQAEIDKSGDVETARSLEQQAGAPAGTRPSEFEAKPDQKPPAVELKKERSPDRLDGFRDRAEARPETAAPAAPPAASADAANAAASAAKATELAQKSAAPVAETRETVTLARSQRVIEFNTADGGVRWQLTAPGSVRRSVDRGATWEVLPLPIQVPLTAGAAPAPTICWLVGRAGTVLLSTDGRRFTQVTAPAIVDLTAVQASDARNATVTAADGRTFRTTDGGQSWQ